MLTSRKYTAAITFSVEFINRTGLTLALMKTNVIINTWEKEKLCAVRITGNNLYKSDQHLSVVLWKASLGLFYIFNEKMSKGRNLAVFCT